MSEASDDRESAFWSVTQDRAALELLFELWNLFSNPLCMETRPRERIIGESRTNRRSRRARVVVGGRPRAKWDEWFEAVERVCRRENLRYLFLASDDEGTYSAFAEHYRRAVDGSARNASSHLPELLPAFVDKALPRGNSIAERRQMWSRDGNVASLAEQLTLATADFVLGTWGSTYSSLAAAWFDRPIEFVPAKPERCRHATHEHPCFWRGDPLYPTPDWDYGSLCRKVIHKLEVRRKQVVPGPRSKPPRSPHSPRSLRVTKPFPHVCVGARVFGRPTQISTTRDAFLSLSRFASHAGF